MSAQPFHHHTLPQNHLASPRSNNRKSSKHHPLPLQSSHSSLDSSPKDSSSHHSSKKILPPLGSLRDTTVGTAAHLKRATSGRNIPQWSETQCKTIANQTTGSQIFPQVTKSGRVVCHPERFRD